jgi:hypothetical protein
MNTIDQDRINDLEAKVEALEARLAGVVKVLSATKPLAAVMSSQGVTRDQARVVYSIVNEMGKRIENGEGVSFVEFEERMTYMVAQLDDRRFLEVIVEALRLERPALAHLCDRFIGAMALIRR